MPVDERELLARLRDAVAALKEVRSQRDALLHAKTEPIAIIGMACRFPGNANTPASFFQTLLDGIDGITEVPVTRWTIDPTIDANPQMRGTRWGAFLDDIDLFDPGFFGISPREAERMDPQQRLLLEVAWESLENSGLVPTNLVGTKTGVFVGILNTDYLFMNLKLPAEQQDLYSATGNGHCFPAGRLSYNFGFQGPSITIDTACSSSLVATHLACQSLRVGESSMAVVGSINLMLDPEITHLFARTGALAPDGRCKSFDARANGFVRGEGCGVMVLKRLSDALRDGDPIVALIRGSAVNQDGRSTGLTTPNVLAQQALLEEALRNAHLSAADIGYIEAHGTGTPLGDPIEMEALISVFGQIRPEKSQCWIGSVKSNIGHLEAAAGIAGLFKSTLALQNEAIPPNLHLRTLNPRISFDSTCLAIPTEVVRWSRGEKPRRAGISSFGMSGTNAHIILEEAPALPVKPKTKTHSSYVLPISAKTPETLLAVVEAYSKLFASPIKHSLDDIAYTASVRRMHHHELRLSLVAESKEEFQGLLEHLDLNELPSGASTGSARVHGRPRVIFVFPGQGSQWLGMGRELYRDEPAFREAIELCDRVIQREIGVSIIDQIHANEARSRSNEIDVLQPLLFSIEVALGALWRSWGIVPDYVVGHSMGEVAAAYVAGLLDMETAAKIICQRSRLMRGIRGFGAMGLISLSMEEVQNAIATRTTEVSIAASNGPQTTVLSGDPQALDDTFKSLEAKGIFCRRINVDVASHSPQVDVLRDELLRSLHNVRAHNGQTRMISTVTSNQVEPSELSAHYWWNNLRQPVLFYQVIQRLASERFSIFLELSPHPILISPIQETLQQLPDSGIVLESMRRQTSQKRVLFETLGALWVQGVPIDWQKIYADGNVAALPTYPWRRQKHWIESTAATAKPKARRESIDDWLFNLEWQLAAPVTHAKPEIESSEAWVIFSDAGRIGLNITMGLRARGWKAIRVDMGETFIAHSTHHYSINFNNEAEYERFFQTIQDNGLVCRAVVHVASVDAPSSDATTIDTLSTYLETAFKSALLVTKSMLRHRFSRTPKLWFISRGAVAIEPNDPVPSVTQASLWGFGRTIMREHPELRCTCIDLDPSTTFDLVTTLIRQLEDESDEEQIALRPHRHYVGRYRRMQLAAAESIPFTLKPDASYLITGGLGGLGLSVANWLVESGARNIALMGRNSPSDAALRAIQRMKDAGATVLTFQGDVALPDHVLSVLCNMTATMPELRGVIHAAGVLDDRTILELSMDNLRTVFAPKVKGAWNLHTLTRDNQLDFFVLYSSGAGLFGSPGQANYAAANTFLDALAQMRIGNDLPATSIQWGAFSNVGLAAAQDNRGARINNLGLANLTPHDGLRVLDQLLRHPRPTVGVLRLNLKQWFDAYPDLRHCTSWLDLAAEATPSPKQVAHSNTSDSSATNRETLRQQVARAPAPDRLSMLVEQIRIHFGKILRVAPNQLTLDESFQHFGMDSLMAIELRNRLQSVLEVNFSVTEIWAHGTISKFASWLLEKLDLPTSVDNTVVLKKSNTQNSITTPAHSGARGQWVVIPRPAPNAKLRLFCFPYAGGSASTFFSWAENMPPEIELCAIEPPGRHSRIDEPIPNTMDEMVNDVTPALIPYLDRPFAMFGHCLGSILMFEVTRRLIDDHHQQPIYLFASGAPPPHRYLVPNFHARSNEEFLHVLQAIGLAQPEVLADPDIVRTMLPMVRADFDIASKYKLDGATGIDVPITTFAADSDVFAPPKIVEQWRLETHSYFASHTFSGGHYFLVPERLAMTQIIAAQMLLRHAALQKSPVRQNSLLWFRRATSHHEKPLRVVCFPGIGGVANDFKNLAASLPANIEFCAIELPGHGSRNNEFPQARVEDIVSEVRPDLETIMEGPIVFVGHDLGALVMYEMTLQLRASGLGLPIAFIVIGAMAPSIHYFAPMHYLPVEAFKGMLMLLDLSFDDQTTSPQSLRADCAAMTSYESTSRDVLDLSIVSISGTNDALIAPASVEFWQHHTSLQFKNHSVPYRHHELRTAKDVTEIIVSEIENANTRLGRIKA